MLTDAWLRTDLFVHKNNIIVNYDQIRKLHKIIIITDVDSGDERYSKVILLDAVTVC